MINHARITYDSPLGPLSLFASAAGLVSLQFPGRGSTGRGSTGREADRDRDAFAEPIAQLDEYFAGLRRAFELELELAGTQFQRRVWHELQQIPYGTTVSYTQVAHRIARPDRVAAVASAIAATPVPIVIPCHRVVASNGALRGYLGGLQRKAALLSLEREVAAGKSPEPAWFFRQTAMQL
jgi:methylated-DNA-[protein]-cysteine S-methyltransferase